MIVATFLLTAAVSGAQLEKAFVDPPREAKPHTWYHMMNGNVTKEGITRDFEALAEIGVGGVQMFDAGCNIPTGPLAFNSPEWFDMFRHAAAEARRLGLEICIPNCSGWSSSGGPWNMPSNGMKRLVFSERRLKGPAKFSGRLAREKNDNGFYEDIAVVAFPTPESELTDISGVKTELAKDTISFASDRPFTLAGFSYRLDFSHIWSHDLTMAIEASGDGKVFAPVETVRIPLARSGGGERGLRYHTFDRPKTVRALRVKFAGHSILARFAVAAAKPERRAVLSNLGAKRFDVRMEVPRDTAVTTPDQTVGAAAVRDLTAGLKSDGTLEWDVPEGDWTVVRLGHVCNGRKNHPASDHGVGLEVDKLSASAMDYHFEQYVARLCRHLGPLAGRVETGFNNILVDSYEVGSQNWTQGFEREFEKRLGYAMTPYYPVFAGRVVGSVDESERFLEDFRLVVAQLFAENYAGALAAKCHQYGLMLSLEPYGSCPTDNLMYGRYADVPMGEFWSSASRGDFSVSAGNSRYISHLAHVWGRKFAATESFTASPDIGGRWTTTPFTIKAQCDRAYTRGVNRIIYHRFTHQPWPDDRYLPGMTMGRWGMHFDRNQTWWPYGGDWIRYQTRCQSMLQQGTFVADGLFYCGEQEPNQGGNTDGNGRRVAQLPDGYAWDVCAIDAFMQLKVVNGRIVVPGGVSYAMLILPDEDTMSPRTMAKLEELVAAGAKVCGTVKPTRAPGLVGYPKADGEIAARAEALWAKGILACEPAEALRRLGLAPDFACAGLPFEGEKGLGYIHRTGGETDWYFVALPNQKSMSFEASFRVTGRVPEIWDAEHGTVRRAALWHERDGRTYVTLDFPVSGSAFVVFREKAKPGDGLTVTAASSAAAKPAPLHRAADFRIDSALYGTFRQDGTLNASMAPITVKDITARLRAAIDAGKPIVAGNALAGGDPVPNQHKNLLVRGFANGQPFNLFVKEYAPVILPSLEQPADEMPAWNMTLRDGRPVLEATRPTQVTVRDGKGRDATFTVESVPGPVAVEGAWTVRFPHAFLPNKLAQGPEETVTFPGLSDWSFNALPGVRYFSGTATYLKTVKLDRTPAAGERLVLDLGMVKNLAEVTVNGKTLPVLWKPPFRVDVTDAAKSGKLELAVKVTNLWANRLIGDDIEHAEDCEWVGNVSDKGSKEIGVRELPAWVKAGGKSPTGRCTFTTWKHWDRNDRLLPSGLIGPVRLLTAVEASPKTSSCYRLGDALVGFRFTAATFGSSNRVTRVATPKQMHGMRVSKDGPRTEIAWRGNDVFGPDFEVVATLTEKGADTWEYALRYSGNTNALPVSELRFPMVEVARTDRTQIFSPDSNGCVIDPEWDKVKPSQCLAGAGPRSIHFTAAITPDGDSWYLDQRGEARRMTTHFEVRNGQKDGRLTLMSSYSTPAVPSADGEMPFTGVLKRFKAANWFDAAAIYRKWAKEQSWYRTARSRDLSRLRDIGFWFWNRGAAEKVIAPVERFQRDSGVPCALDWYWWHDIPYDTSFPNFWPPREGEQTFRAAVARCRRNGIFIQVYTNGMTWDADDPTWPEGGEEGVLKLYDGQMLAHAFNRFNNHRLAYMCSTADKYRTRMRGLYRTLKGTGLPGIYLDMIGNTSYRPCYSTEHRHVPGGGSYPVDGFREFVRQIRQENPGVLLSTEDATEAYLDVFESGIVLCDCFERFGNGHDRKRYVPAHNAVYHGCAALFGSFAMVHGVPAFDPKWPTEKKWKEEKDWKAMFPDQFAVELGRGVVWGMQPMVHNFLLEHADDPHFAEDYRLMIDTARFYHANRDFLFDGEMLSPGVLACAVGKSDFLIRSTYAREGEYRVCTRTNLEKVLHGVWRAPDGRVAAVLYNWTREPQKFSLKTPDLKASGEIAPRSWKLVVKSEP